MPSGRVSRFQTPISNADARCCPSPRAYLEPEAAPSLNAFHTSRGRAVMSDTTDRRQFLKTTLAAGLGAAVAGSGQNADASQGPAAQAAGPKLFAAPPIDHVRIGIIGLGHQGSSHLRNFLKVPGVEVRALCDLVPAKVEKALAA